MSFHQKNQLYNSKILVVEDESVNIKIIQIHLEKAGYQNISYARNGLEALEVLKETKPDLIILDIMMPVMNGFDVLKNVRGLYTYEELPIIVQTSLDNKQEQQHVWELGANDIVQKPIHKQELLSRLYVHLHQYWLLKELQEYKKTAQEDIKSSLSLQLSLLPSDKLIEKIEKDYNVKIDYIFKPCRFLSGDLWGLTPIDEDQFALWMFDFSGKGIRAALNTFRLHTLLHDHHLTMDSPKLVLEQCNDTLDDLLSVGSFATCLYSVVNVKEKSITYASASSPHPILYDMKNKEFELLQSDGRPLGITKNSVYESHKIQLKDAHSFVLYSDAMWESSQDLGFSFEEDQLNDFIKILDGKKIVPSVKIILDSIGEEDLSISDDLTIIELSFE